MHSHLVPQPRRIPRQPRGQRRVAQLLQAAAGVIAAVGYEAATMSAIAERAGAPIGSLYQFFPNKQSITHALRTEYGKDYAARLNALEAEAKGLSLEELSGRLISLSVNFVRSHPAFLPLLDAPLSTRSPESLRRMLRERLARCLAAVIPSAAPEESLRLATVTLQLIRGLNQLYAEAPVRQRREYVREYRVILCSWLTTRMEHRVEGDCQ